MGTIELPAILTIAEYYPASREGAVAVLEQMIVTDDATESGRSGWEWIRLADGTLFFGCRPIADGYFAVEGYFTDDWQAAEKAGTGRTITADTANDFRETVYPEGATK